MAEVKQTLFCRISQAKRAFQDKNQLLTTYSVTLMVAIRNNFLDVNVLD